MGSTVRFVSVRTEKKLNCFEDTLIESVFWRFFQFFGFFEKVLLASVVLIPVRNTETNRNKPKIFIVSRKKPKNNRNRLSFGLFQFEPKKIDCFEDTLGSGGQLGSETVG